MAKQIVNIINFVRGTEPRLHIELLDTMKSQLKELKERGLKATFLFQYDALADNNFTDAFMPYREDFEAGLWIELVKECIEKAGEKWRGEKDWEWDWHGNICNTVGYTPDARRKMTDVCMEKFKEVFGYYPKSVGAWAIDAVTLEHLEKKYNIAASCNCKEQWGTDGYTLWGGYYGHGYYPSKFNSLCPAQSEEFQINVPVFRMLGSDPVYQYDAGLDINGNPSEAQPVVTLEPVYTGHDGGGGVPHWVDWFFRENFNGKALSFSYVQAGQENSFGWERMKDGFLYQMDRIKEMQEAGTIETMTLGETGLWFKNSFKESPPVSIPAESDFKNDGRKSYWYCCKNYRINVYFENGSFFIRDIYLYDQFYRERYLNAICETEGYIFDNLPVVDGNRHSGKGIRSGLFPCVIPTGRTPQVKSVRYDKDKNGINLLIYTDYFGLVEMRMSLDSVSLKIGNNISDFSLKYQYNPSAKVPYRNISGSDTVCYEYNGRTYSVKTEKGRVSEDGSVLHFIPDEEGQLKIAFGRD